VSRGQGARVHVIVTCTKRKTRPPHPGLRVRDVRAPTAEARADAWIARLRAAAGDFVPARRLYAGDHWSVALSIPDAAPAALDVRLWVCSAGYGLIPVDAPLAPYSATFSQTHEDAVDRGIPGVPRYEAWSTWWTRIAGWEGPVPGEPRSFAALAAADPGASLLVIAAAPYLRALSGDLHDAVPALGDPGRLAIVSAAARHLRGLADHVVPFDDRLQQRLGGGDMSLNVRVARELLRQGVEPVRGELARAAEGLARDLERRGGPVRPPQTDAEVRAFIRAELERDPSARWTPLLRRLRDERGLACEQKRFRGLFKTTLAEHAAEPPSGGSPDPIAGG
jgi:hypothetical protein